jgi:hypothetical protein
MRPASILVVVAVAMASSVCRADERTEHFDHDPQWDGVNNRATSPEPQLITQDFGYSRTQHAGGTKVGEIGGLLTPAAEPCFYAKPLETKSFGERVEASGKFACTGRQFHILVGFFNASTINEWRTPNSIVLRLYGRGDVFYAYVEYATSRWRAGGDSPGGFSNVIEAETGRPQLKGFAGGTPHTWSLVYDPQGNNGAGRIVAKIDDETAVCHLDAGHKDDGATFNRFGVLNIPKSFDQGGEVWFDDLTFNGQTEHFDRDPQWEAVGNRRTYRTPSVRPRFDFGFSGTNFAGGKAAGELGGEIFRGDRRYPERLAYYGDRIGPLTLNKPIRAGGRVTLRRGVSDSTTLLGFFNSMASMAVSETQPVTGFPESFLGVAVEGPSREGFLLYPVCHTSGGTVSYAYGSDLPHILPDGQPHDWSLEYEPPTGNHPGRLQATLDGEGGSVEIAKLPESQVEFDRFGIITTWIDGNAQRVYFDDLTYTVKQ